MRLSAEEQPGQPTGSPIRASGSGITRRRRLTCHKKGRWERVWVQGSGGSARGVRVWTGKRGGGGCEACRPGRAGARAARAPAFRRHQGSRSRPCRTTPTSIPTACHRPPALAALVRVMCEGCHPCLHPLLQTESIQRSQGVCARASLRHTPHAFCPILQALPPRQRTSDAAYNSITLIPSRPPPASPPPDTSPT